MGASLRRRGITVGTVDLILAAVALRLPVPVWSLDAHFQAIARHGGERMTDDLAFQIGGMGLNALLSQKSPATRNVVLAAYGVGGQIGVMLPFSRSEESEADHIGLVYMAKAGYDPQEALNFWKRMEQQGGGQPPQFLSTHPSHETRIQDLQKWIPQALQEYRKSPYKK